MSRIFVFIVVLLFAQSVVAAEPAKETKAESKLTIADCQTILAGLKGLDGRQEITKDGSAVTTPYQFGNAKLRLALQQNIARLNDLQQDFVKVQQDLFREVAGDASEIKPNTAEMVRYQKLILDALQAPCNIELQRIKAEDLKLDKNEIQGSVLSALDKILDK